MNKPLLEIRDLGVTFDTERGTIRPVQNVSFTVFAGQTVKVQNTANGQTVYATVVDARRVRITMEGDNE